MQSPQAISEGDYDELHETIARHERRLIDDLMIETGIAAGTRVVRTSSAVSDTGRKIAALHSAAGLGGAK